MNTPLGKISVDQNMFKGGMWEKQKNSLTLEELK